MVAQRRRLEALTGGGGEPAHEDAARGESPPVAGGLPDPLRSGIESLSGVPMDGVQVHYNSSRPAGLDALAFARGNEIHLGPGQENHLPHEAWHVVQQAQGRVRPTGEVGGVALNDDASLEAEADAMGTKALQMRASDARDDRPVGGRSPDLVQASAWPIRTAPTRDRPPPSPDSMSVQRLAVQDTQWGDVTGIRASEGGVGGVLFFTDGGSTVVVKPNTMADEEMIATHLHGQMSDAGRTERTVWHRREQPVWGLGGLDARMADAADVVGIQAAADRLGRDTLDPRAPGLLDDVAAGTTLIQEGVQGARGYRELLAGQADQGHLKPAEDRKRGRTDKIKKDSPLKPFTQSPEFSRTLGRMAAVDIFMGHFDRLMGSANLDNFLVNVERKSVHPIDNVHEASRVQFTQRPGAGPVSLESWASHGLVQKFIAGHYEALAKEAWAHSAKDLTETTHVPIWADIVEGRVAEGEGSVPTVANEERDAVKAKLLKHLDDIKKSFVEGLEAGRQQIVDAGELPQSEAWSEQARTQYNLRLAVLRG